MECACAESNSIHMHLKSLVASTELAIDLTLVKKFFVDGRPLQVYPQDQ